MWRRIALAGLGWSLLAGPAFAAPDWTDVCVSRDARLIYKVPGTPLPGGRVRIGEDTRRVADLPQARGLAWFEAGEPVLHKGWTYRKVGEPRREDWPLGRYNRFQPRYRGAPMMEPLGGEDRVLLVLADPVGCLFQRYERDPGGALTSAPGP